MTITRREWLVQMMGSIAGAAALSALLSESAHAGVPRILMVYKDPNCGCCAKWITHIKANGLAPVVQDRKDMDALKDSLGIPMALRSCHTMVAGTLLIEGHVPADDVKKFIASAPRGVLGIAVPGMPTGSPGMEMGTRKDKYDVIAFGPDGKTHVFATHG